MPKIKETGVAVKIARAAGQLLLKSFKKPRGHRVSFKAHHEPVTKIDFDSNRLIAKKLSAAFPGYSILSEEGVAANRLTLGNKPTWIVDPLDGTSNYIAGLPLFAVVIALVVGGRPILGIIFDPLHDELFVAERGGGTRLNGRRCHVSRQENTRGAILFAGRGYRHRDKTRHGKIIFALEQQTTYFRRLGSAAIMLSSVAAGRADATILTGDKPWDTAAGILLVEEAGGKVTDYQGHAWTLKSEDLVVSNGIIHNKIVALTSKNIN